MFTSTKFALLFVPQLLILFIAPTALALVKRQSAPPADENGAADPAEDPHVGFEGNDPPPSSLNEPITAIGADHHQQQIEDVGGKVADFAYDTVEDQSPTSSSSASAATVSQGSRSDNGGGADIRLKDSSSTTTTTAAEEDGSSPSSSSSAAATEDAAAEEEGGGGNASSSSSDSSDATAVTPGAADGDDEQHQRLDTVTTTEATVSSSATRAAKKKDERKAHKKTGLPTAAVETASAAAAASGDGTAAATASSAQKSTRNCNSERIRQLIIENMHSKPSVAKRQIQSKVAEEINGKIDVICARHAFSYIVNSELFCEAEHNGVICLCFKQQ